MTPTTPTPINPSLILQTETGDGGSAGAVAVATSAAKRGSEPSVRRNPGRVAKQDGMSKLEVAGGTPRKKVRNMVSHALRIDCKKAKIAQANAEHKGLVNADGPNQWSDEGRFKKGQVKIAARRNPDSWAKLNGKGIPVPVETGEEDPSSGEEYLLLSKNERVETDDEANDKAVAASGRGTDDMVQPRLALALAWNPRGSPPPKFVMPDQPGNGAARGLAALHGEPYGNPKIVRDKHEGPSVGALAAGMKRAAAGGWEAHEQMMAARHGMESDEEANCKVNPPQVLTALFGLTTTLEEANLEATPPQVLMALFGLTKALRQANFKATPPPSVDGIVWLNGGVGIDHRGQNPGKNRTGHKRCQFFTGDNCGGGFQGQTGQGISDAVFFPQGHQYEKEAGAHGVSTRGRKNDKEAGLMTSLGQARGRRPTGLQTKTRTTWQTQFRVRG